MAQLLEGMKQKKAGGFSSNRFFHATGGGALVKLSGGFDRQHLLTLVVTAGRTG
jgi:hypothetical protein